MAFYIYPPQSSGSGGDASAANQVTQIAQLTQIEADLSLDVVDQLDSVLLDTSSSNIPGSASSPLQIVATTAAVVQKLSIVEDIGEYYGIYTGAAASEVLKCVVPLGGGEVQVQIPMGTRISVRSLTATAISVGKLAINFLG